MADFSPETVPSSREQEIRDTVSKLVHDMPSLEYGENEIRPEFCTQKNGALLIKLLALGLDPPVSGIVYTVAPGKEVPGVPELAFSDEYSDWKHHSIVVVHVENDQYLAVDCVNTQIEGEKLGSTFFMAGGKLEDLSGKLAERFGSTWNLEFSDENNPQLTVAGKIGLVEREIEERKKQFTYSDIVKTPKDTVGLGLTFRPDFPMKDLTAKKRLLFTDNRA